MGRLRRRRRSQPGGIVALADLIAAHRGAFEHDWRARFGVPLHVIGESMTWSEALRLMRILRADGSSMVCAALGEWQYPAGREALALADLYDALCSANFKSPAPYPRPWDAAPVRHGRSSLTPAQFRAILERHRRLTDEGATDG